MNRNSQKPNRRLFLASSIAAAATSFSRSRPAIASEPRNKICAFIKFLQTLSYEELARTIADLGFDGIEATVRRNGHVLPERVEDDLPKLVNALNQHGLEITVMASDVNQVDELSQRVLTTAAQLGVKKYRMGNYRYDLSQPILTQLDQLKPTVRELVQFSRKLGITPVYQNHSGAQYVGAAIWDLHYLIKDYPASDIGIAFDIRHATVEGGLSWPTVFNLMRPHLGAIYVKDFAWDGRRPANVPLGKGQVDPRFFKLLRQTGFSGPISLHVEYLHEAGTAENIKALQTDLKTMRMLLQA